ncbi:MAG: SH3 domain-containing protein [Chitinophagaceae bacterium]
MRITFLMALLAVSFTLSAQSPYGSFYVAAKTGLSMRETPAADARVVDKIPYGTKITLTEEEGAWKEIITEGLTGYWRKVKYNNKTGYIVDSYLFPWPPPKKGTVTTMSQYLAQVTVPFGARLVTRSGTMTQLTESGWELNKQLYKNGAEHHNFMAYEYASDTYFLPGFSLQQGFLLLRLLAEFKDVFAEKDEFPTKSKKTDRGDDSGYEIRLIKTVEEEEYGGPFTIEKIRISFNKEAAYEFEMYLQDNQLVIFFGSGL